jgi:hypothetical protein
MMTVELTTLVELLQEGFLQRLQFAPALHALFQ